MHGFRCHYFEKLSLTRYRCKPSIKLPIPASGAVAIKRSRANRSLRATSISCIFDRLAHPRSQAGRSHWTRKITAASALTTLVVGPIVLPGSLPGPSTGKQHYAIRILAHHLLKDHLRFPANISTPSEDKPHAYQIAITESIPTPSVPPPSWLVRYQPICYTVVRTTVVGSRASPSSSVVRSGSKKTSASSPISHLNLPSAIPKIGVRRPFTSLSQGDRSLSAHHQSDLFENTNSPYKGHSISNSDAYSRRILHRSSPRSNVLAATKGGTRSTN